MDNQQDQEEYYEVPDNIILLDVFSGCEIYTDSIIDILEDE